MTSGWARTQGVGWLYRLVFPDEEEVQEKSTTRQIFRILEDLMSHKASSKDLATETASLVASNPAAWDDVLGIYLSAAEKVADEDALKALVDYIVQLASLPDAFNESHEALIVDHIGYAGTSVRIEPGEPLVIGDGGKRLWRDLPNFSMNITERFQGKLFLLYLISFPILHTTKGPEQYLDDIRTPANSHTAKTSWGNFNTYLALRAISSDAQTILVLANGVRLARMTLVIALEHSPEQTCQQSINQIIRLVIDLIADFVVL
jgi:hypothetical protein